jgi:hypothetical protein
MLGLDGTPVASWEHVYILRKALRGFSQLAALDGGHLILWGIMGITDGCCPRYWTLSEMMIAKDCVSTAKLRTGELFVFFLST